MPAANSASTVAIAIAKRRVRAAMREQREAHGDRSADARGRSAQRDDVRGDPLVLQAERLRPDQHERDGGGAEHDGPAEDAGEHSTQR